MDFEDTPAEATFRAEARAWLESMATLRSDGDGAWRTFRSKTIEDDAHHLEAARRWQRTCLDAGWAGIHWPVEYGGRGLSAHLAGIFSEEQAHYDVRANFFMIGVDMVGPTLMRHGTEAQRMQYLQPTLRGDISWCQLFSEPGAGSDLAALSTRAVRDGDSYVVNGQKVWTSSAHTADYGILLVRTDPDAPKHKGISYLVVDMRSPGIEIRPLRQIDGAIHFNEVFLDDVHVPVENLVGEENGGWAVAMTTLTAERTAIGGGGGTRLADLLRLARTCGVTGDPLWRQRLARLHTTYEIQRWLSYRVRTAVSHGRQPGPESSVMKLINSHHVGVVGDVAVELQGAAGMLWSGDARDDGFWQDIFLFQWSSRIGGGTEQIQRNVIAERVLGMPRQ